MFRFAAHPQSKTPRLRQIGLVALACSVLIVSGCGGGTRKKEYMPERIVSFGDENSAMTTYVSNTLDVNGSAPKTIHGLVYTVNNVPTGTVKFCSEAGVNTACVTPVTTVTSYTPPISANGYVLDAVNTGGVSNVVTRIELGTGDYASVTAGALKRTIDNVYSCASNSIWIQVIAHGFGKGYQTDCPLEANANAKTYAAYGAKVVNVAAQVSANRADLRDGTLVTIMVGQNDILEVYNAVKATTRDEASATAELLVRAQTMANVVKDIMNTGAKVVLALTPDLGNSPLGVTSGDAAMLTRLTKAFNDALYIAGLANSSGRNLAGVNPEPFTNPQSRSPAGVYGVALCDPAKTMRPDGSLVSAVTQSIADGPSPLKYCTNSTSNFVANGSTATYMWADSTHFSSLGHVQIGSAGLSRAANQF